MITGETTGTASGVSFNRPGEDLGALALYWDKIALTYGNGVGYSMNKEDGISIRPGVSDSFIRKCTILEQTGMLRVIRLDVDHPSWDPGAGINRDRMFGIPLGDYPAVAIARIRLLAQELNIGSRAGVWSAGRTLEATRIPGLQRTVPDSGVLAVELTLRLPVPPADVPIENILKFRERNALSLLALRRGIRSLTESTDANIADLLNEIHLACAEIDRRLSEKFIQRWARRTSVILGLQNVAQSAVLGTVGELIGHSIHMPEGAGSALGLAASGALQLAQKTVPSEYVLPDRIADFYYVYASSTQLRR